LAILGGSRLKSVGLTAFVLTTLLFKLLFTNFDTFDTLNFDTLITYTTFGGRPRPRFVVGVELIAFSAEQTSFIVSTKVSMGFSTSLVLGITDLIYVEHVVGGSGFVIISLLIFTRLLR
jgi:hypothetical protein